MIHPLAPRFPKSRSRFTRVPRAALAALLIAAWLAAPVAAQGPERGGFTMLLSLGAGFQNDKAIGSTETGLAGLNLGIGGFISENAALWFRASGTNVAYGNTRQVSGVGGPAVQYFVDDQFALEGGIGVGFWDIEGTNESGLGLILGASYAFFNSGKHNLLIGVEYAPAFTDPETVHNFGIVFGWQLL